MDKNLLEFWGQIFLNAARSQQQMEDWNKWFSIDSFGKNKLFSSLLNQPETQKTEEITPEILEIARKATDAYKEVFKASLSLFDVVAKEDYDELLKENELLKEKVKAQENIIKNRRNQPEKDIFEQQEVVNNLTEIVKDQTQQFQDLMKQMGKYYKKELVKK